MSNADEATSSSSSKAASTDILDERRIWVGNLDQRLSEYQLLKIVQKCGKVEKFDMMFHKGGPSAGQSRGYAFVTFASSDAALKALEGLNGTLIANRPIAVRLAKNVNYDDLDRHRPRIEIPALGTGLREGKISKAEAIRAIENKLKMLERNKETDLEFNADASNAGGMPQIPIIQRYQYNKNRDNERGGYGKSRGGSSYSGRSTYQRHGSSHPYNRNQRR